MAGEVMAIGGHEDQTGECRVLRHLVQLAGGPHARMAVVATASYRPGETAQDYRRLFLRLGAGQALALPVDSRSQAQDPHLARLLAQATAVFFSGGDQLRLTAIVGGTQVEEAIRRAHAQGAVVAGTSAGASALSSIMIVGGEGEAPARRSVVHLSPGLGFLENVLIDQHFAQRGRLGRLLAAVGQNPGCLGVGIDEDTALVAQGDTMWVVGSGSVTVVDGRSLEATTVSEADLTSPLTLTHLTLHVLSQGFGLRVSTRTPIPYPLADTVPPLRKDEQGKEQGGSGG